MVVVGSGFTQAHQNTAAAAKSASTPNVAAEPLQETPPSDPTDVLTAMREVQAAASIAANSCDVQDTKFRDMKRRERNIGAR